MSRYDQVRRLPLRLEAHRERPLLERDGVGPWNGRVSVTPIADITTTTRTQTYSFEVNVQWLGPPLAIAAVPEGAPHGLPRDHPVKVQASDVYYTPSRELALELAERATVQLRQPARPDLRTLAVLLKRRK